MRCTFRRNSDAEHHQEEVRQANLELERRIGVRVRVRLRDVPRFEIVRQERIVKDQWPKLKQLAVES